MTAERQVNPEGVVIAPIPSYPGYFAGEDGSIWSTRTGNWVKRKTTINRSYHGRLYVSLSTSSGVFVKPVHRLVLEAFSGQCPVGMHCCHNDGNGLNNAISNLRWDTPKANAADSVRHGTKRNVKGSKNVKARLCESDIPIIAKMFKEGLSTSYIAGFFKMSANAIRSVLAGRSWTHVTGIERNESIRRSKHEST